MKELPMIFKTFPVVFALNNNYHIMVLVNEPCLMWVKVGSNEYYDESNGILRSSNKIHRMIVPIDELDKELNYQVVYRKIIERKPYFPLIEEPVFINFKFKPVKETPINIYHISDAHNKVETPVKAGSYFKDKLNLLILNGDIPNHSGEIKYFDTIYEIAGSITKGNIPVIFSRGNHDMRGFYAENLIDYTPHDNGNSYFTFRLGPLWGVVLDCGEDKDDDHSEYGGTISCHAFRLRQTKFLENIVKNASKEYGAEGIKHKVVISHIPFTDTFEPPFNIEKDVYAKWVGILDEHIKPDIMICGHMHDTRVDFSDKIHDEKGNQIPIVIGSNPFLNKEDDIFIGAAITLEDNRINVKFTDHTGKIFNEAKIR